MIATKKCPNCGLDNSIGRSICENCTTPLNKYGKEVGMDDFERRLAKQVEALDSRPPIVYVMCLFTLLLTIAPISRLVYIFRHQPKPDPEHVNAMATALASLGPIFAAVTLIPIAVALVVVALLTWTQRPWTWMVNLIVLAISIGVMVVSFQFRLPTFLWLALCGTFAFFWTRPRTKAWFALN